MRAIFDRLGKAIPATNKWWTFQPTQTTQALGLGCHKLLRSVIAEAFSSDGEPGPEDDAYRVEQHRRLQTSHDWVMEDKSEACTFSSLIVSEPADKVSAALQHYETSHKHKSLAALLSPTGLLHDAELKYYSILTERSGLPFLQEHFAFSHEAEDALNVAREELLATAGQFWARIVTVVEDGHFKLLSMPGFVATKKK